MEERNEIKKLQSARRSQERSDRKSSLPLVLLFALVAIVLGLWYRQFGPSRIHISENSLFGVQGGEVAALYNYELQSDKVVLGDGGVYLPLALAKRGTSRRFYWDRDEKYLIYAAPGGVRTFTAEEVDTGGKPLFFIKDQASYLSLPLFHEFTNVHTEAYTGGEVKRPFVETTPESDEMRATKRKTVLRSRPNVRGSIVTVAAKVEALRMIPDHADAGTDTARWVRVEADSGFTGYVQQRSLQAAEMMPYQNSFAAQGYGTLSISGEVLFGLHLVSNQAANQGLSTPVGNAGGMNMIVPTRFSFRGNEGDYQNYVDRACVEAAHEKNLRIFTLPDNFNESVTTGELLKRTSVQKRLIDSLMAGADLYGSNSINVDLELIKQEATDQYLEFIYELSVAYHVEQLYLTVDVPSPAKFNAYYDKKEPAAFCNYTINMGYDGHAGGDAPGGTAPLDFVTTGLGVCLERIPKEKLIQAVPFYTQLQTEDKNSKVLSEALDMKTAQGWVNKNQIGLTYDETLGQSYGQRSANESIQPTWMEDAKSMQARIEVIRARGPAGIIVWRLSLETTDV